METGDDYVVKEIEKTKKKLKDISSILENQQLFLRLIVQVSVFFNYLCEASFLNLLSAKVAFLIHLIVFLKLLREPQKYFKRVSTKQTSRS